MTHRRGDALAPLLRAGSVVAGPYGARGQANHQAHRRCNVDLALLTIIAQLIFLEGVLSLDNAAVLGAMVQRPLPTDQPVHWSRSLRWLGNALATPLGPQRAAALKVGLLGAYAGRGLMLLVATYVIHNPWLRLVGALYLLYRAVSYLAALGRARAPQQPDAPPARRPWLLVGRRVPGIDRPGLQSRQRRGRGRSLGSLVGGAAWGGPRHRHDAVFAASLFSRLIAWEPALEHAAHLLILAIAVDVILEDLGGLQLNELVQFGISVTRSGPDHWLARWAWLRPSMRCGRHCSGCLADCSGRYAGAAAYWVGAAAGHPAGGARRSAYCRGARPGAPGRAAHRPARRPGDAA